MKGGAKLLHSSSSPGTQQSCQQLGQGEPQVFSNITKLEFGLSTTSGNFELAQLAIGHLIQLGLHCSLLNHMPNYWGITTVRISKNILPGKYRIVL